MYFTYYLILDIFISMINYPSNLDTNPVFQYRLSSTILNYYYNLKMKLIMLILLIELVSCRSVKTHRNIALPAGEPYLIRQPSSFEFITAQTIYIDDRSIELLSIGHQLKSLIKGQYHLSNQTSDQMLQNNWQRQFVSSVLQIDNQQIYTITSSGQIIQICYQSVQNNTTFSQIQRYTMTNYDAQWIQINLFADNGDLYGLYQGDLISIQLNQNASWNWGQKLIAETVLRVINYDVSIYALTEQKLYVFHKGLSMQEYDALQNETFIDFDIDQGNLFLLTSQCLLILDVVSFEKQYCIGLQQIQKAKRLRIKNKKLIVQFKRNEEFLLRQYIISEVNLTKGAIHRQYQDVKQIIMLDKLAIIVQNLQINFLILSINNTARVMTQDKQISIVYRNIIEVKVVHAVDQDIFLIVVLPTSIQFVQIKNKLQHFRLFQNYLNMMIEKPGIYEMNIYYFGFCFKQILVKCQQTVELKFQVQSDQKSHIFLLVDIVLILSYSIIFIIIVCLYYWRKLLLEQLQYQNKITQIRESTASSQYIGAVSNQDQSQVQATSKQI